MSAFVCSLYSSEMVCFKSTIGLIKTVKLIAVKLCYPDYLESVQH